MIRTAALSVFFFALLWLPGHAPAAHPGPPPAVPDRCGLCGGKQWMPCERCETKGSYKVMCRRCNGRREFTCPVCDGSARCACPGCGGSGKIVWETSREKDTCKVCSRGSVTCPFCDGRKKVGCPVCQGEGKIEMKCGACCGLGGFPCPRCASPSPCPACSGTKQMPCFHCFGDGKFPVRCEKCYGYGIQLCNRCIGGRDRCRECAGSGRIRFVSGGRRAGVQRCETCGGRGWEKCERCGGKGNLECPPYDGFEPCSHCPGGSGRIPCTVCAGSG